MALPHFTVGEPKRDYKFHWQILPRDSITLLKEAAKIFKSDAAVMTSLKALWQFLGSTASSLFISQLAQKIELPKLRIRTSKIDLAGVAYPLPEAFEIENIVVTYLEDELNGVYLFHRKWMDMARQASSSANKLFNFTNSVGPYFRPLALCSMQAYYIPMASVASLPSNANVSQFVAEMVSGALSEVPTGLECYPRIFPIDVSRSAADKSGKGFGVTTVTYIRIPKLEFQETDLISNIKSSFGF